MGTTLRRDSIHPGIFDSELFGQEGQLLPQPMVLLLESHAGVPAIGGPAPGMGQGELCERNGVDDAGSDTTRPALGRGIRGGREESTMKTSETRILQDPVRG